MTKEEFYEKTVFLNGKSNSPHERMVDYYACLLALVDSHRSEKPSYTLFFKLFAKAFHTPLSEFMTDEERENHDQKYNIYIVLDEISSGVASSDVERVLCFLKAQIQFGRVVDYYESEVWLVEFIVEKCGDFLGEASNQALFEAKNITWHYFIILLEELFNYRIHTRLQCRYGYCVLNCLKLHPQMEWERKDIGFLAWIAAAWRMVSGGRSFLDKFHGDFFNRNIWSGCYPFQSYTLKWREEFIGGGTSGEIRREIYDQCFRAIQRSTSDEALAIMQAARMLDVAYPFEEGIGNADGVFYDELFHEEWTQFSQHRGYFEALLNKVKVFDYEWITLAQVLWLFYRDVNHEAMEYFLETALRLNPSIPIHYFDMKYWQHDSKNEEETRRHTMQSGLGITWFYYAEMQYYHKRNNDEALRYYTMFCEAEPQYLPNNDFERDAMDYFVHRSRYPASTQEAKAQIARIYLQMGDVQQAEIAAEEAIALRPNNFQTPYEVLADVKAQQGLLREQIALLEAKAAAMVKTRIRDVSVANRRLYGYPIDGFADETGKNPQSFVMVFEVYLKIADLCAYSGNTALMPKAREAHKKAISEFKRVKLSDRSLQFGLKNVDISSLHREYIGKQQYDSNGKD